MSFTVYRTKNGQQVPITVSVFDAFRSRPPTISRPKSSTGIKNSTGVGGANGHFDHGILLIASHNVKQGKKSTDAVAAGTSTSNGGADEVWTKKDDAKLLELKNKNATWAVILEALGDKHTSKSGATARFKLLSSGGEVEDEKKMKAEKAKAEGLKKKPAAGGKGGESNKGKKKMFGGCTANDLKTMADKYDKDKWLAMASRHFDRTGVRISAEMAKRMCEKKS